MGTASQQPTAPYTLYMSDEAYLRLCELATEYGYLSTGNETAKGIGAFIDAIMRNPLTDTRPEDIREEDNERKQAGYAGEWQMYYPRKRRRVHLQDTTLVWASTWSVCLGIATSSRLSGAPHYKDSPQCLSILLEAIGTDWIGISHVANKQQRTKTRTQR